jgi:carbon-monoxide dehydrogenase small subunit
VTVENPTGWDPTPEIRLNINGTETRDRVEPAMSLMDFVRDCGLTGTHAACEHGVCGACTVLLDGDPVRSCIVLAVQADGGHVETVEGLGDAENPHALQVAFSRCGGLQCGFCTPGFLMLSAGFLRQNPCPTDEELRDALSSNLCRCTGYDSIVKAVKEAAGIDALTVDHSGPPAGTATPDRGNR